MKQMSEFDAGKACKSKCNAWMQDRQIGSKCNDSDYELHAVNKCDDCKQKPTCMKHMQFDHELHVGRDCNNS